MMYTPEGFEKETFYIGLSHELKSLVVFKFTGACEVEDPYQLSYWGDIQSDSFPRGRVLFDCYWKPEESWYQVVFSLPVAKNTCTINVGCKKSQYTEAIVAAIKHVEALGNDWSDALLTDGKFNTTIDIVSVEGVAV